MASLTKSARDNFIMCVIMLTLATVSVFVRFLTRLSHHNTLLGADWMCLGSLCLFAVYCALIINFIFNTSQYHALDANLAFGITELVNISKMTFIAEIFFSTSLTFIKLSILWFYDTLFSVNDTMLRVTRVTAILCVIWYLTVTFVIILQCNPVSAYWEAVDSPLYCLSSPAVLLGYEMSNLFLDVIILCIPVTIVPRLRLSTPKKATVLGIFLLGALVCVCSILRLTAIWNPPDVLQNFNFSLTFFLATMQLGLGIICGCLPTFSSAMLHRTTNIFESIKTLYAAMKSRATGVSTTDQYSGANSIRRPWVKVGEDRRNAESRAWAYGSNRRGEPDISLSPIPSRSILVNRELEVV